MRRRPAPDPHATEVARRRLEALSRELGLEGAGAGPDSGGARTGAGAGPGTGAGADPRSYSRGGSGGGSPLGRQTPSLPVDEELDADLGGVAWSGQPRPASHPPFHARPGIPARQEVRRAPGRHSLPRLTWRERLADWYADRSIGGSRQFGAAHLAVVALLVAVSLAVGAWHTMRGSVEQAPVVAPTLSESPGDGAAAAAPDAGADPAAVTGATPAPAGATASAGPGTVADEVVVDVVGRVRKPGIAILPAGSRVVDALKAAGGARPGVRTDSLNLARPLTDGEQIVVGQAAALTAPPAPASGVAPVAPGAAASPTALVNLNTADQVALETLPGVGPVTAAAILQWRTEHGGFTAVEELLEVSGIGDATLAEIAPHVTI